MKKIIEYLKQLSTKNYTAIIFVLIISIYGIYNISESFHKIRNYVSQSSYHSSKELVLKINEGFNDNFCGKLAFIDFYGVIQLALNKQEFANFELVKDKNGYLYQPAILPDNTEFANKIKIINDYLQTQNTPLLFIIPPSKISLVNNDMSSAYINNSGKDIDKLIKLFKDRNIDYMDLRENIKNDKLNTQTLFYKTDHHWREKTAFWATGEIISKLNNDYNFKIDSDIFFRDLNNYNQKHYTFWGSYGWKAGKQYSGLDDFILIYPKFKTNFDVTYVDTDNTKTTINGDYLKSLIFHLPLDVASPYLAKSRFAAYLNRNLPEVIIKNKMKSKYKILLFNDSYFRPIATFLAPLVGEMRVIDLRAYKDFDLKGYINEYKPDIVLIGYNINVLSPAMAPSLSNSSK